MPTYKFMNQTKSILFLTFQHPREIEKSLVICPVIFAGAVTAEHQCKPVILPVFVII
jgi:hypothetical protein